MKNEKFIQDLNLILTATYIINDNLNQKIVEMLAETPRKITGCFSSAQIYSKKEMTDGSFWVYVNNFEKSIIAFRKSGLDHVVGDKMIEIYGFDMYLKEQMPISNESENILSFSEVYMTYEGEDGERENRMQRYDLTVARPEKDKYIFSLYHSNDIHQFKKIGTVEMDMYNLDTPEAKQIMNDLGLKDPTK